MSATQTQASRPTKRPQKRLNSAEKQAVIAAVAMGQPKTIVAQQFGVHVNTIHNLCASVRRLDHPANPLAKDWKEGARVKARTAVEAGLDAAGDPYKRASIGVKVLEGLGDLQTGAHLQVEGTVQMVVSWSGSRQPERTLSPVDEDITVVDVSPVESTPVT